jgi:hypothetical protein
MQKKVGPEGDSHQAGLRVPEVLLQVLGNGVDLVGKGQVAEGACGFAASHVPAAAA